MHLHQVLTGAVNPGDCCYSVGSVNDIPFTVSGFIYSDPIWSGGQRAAASRSVGAASRFTTELQAAELAR